MASQPSAHNEERNRLRLRAWEQRNQEASQTKDLSAENVPLFGEPYKTNKGDELSNRIQRMLGRYEDVNNPSPAASEPSPGSASSQCDQSEKPTRPPFHEQAHFTPAQSQTGPSSSIRTSTGAPSPPAHHGLSSTLANGPGGQTKGEAFSDLRECAGLPQETSARSPDGQPLPFLHSSDHDNTDSKGGQRCPLAGRPPDASGFSLQQSPRDTLAAQASLGAPPPPLPQAFPPPLASKPPSSAVTQKPTAYVRPMDGQDQVVNESPELKPSPEPYAPLQEIITDKSDHGKTKKLPQFLETRTDESLCVEDILREMTHSWPPLLTAIHIPSTDGLPTAAKEVERVSSCSGQKNYSYSPTGPSHQNLQSCSSEAAHSSEGESASSSDSESSSRSESDGESAPEGPPPPPPPPLLVSSSKAEPDAPTVGCVDWQLGRWINQIGQPGAHVSQSPSRKRPQPVPGSSKRPGVEVTEPAGGPPPPPLAQRLSGDLPKPQDNHCQQSSPMPTATAAARKSSGSKPVKAVCPKPEDVAAAVAGRTDHPDRPKVKTEAGRCKKSDAKRDRKRTLKHASKAEAEPARPSSPAEPGRPPPPPPPAVAVGGKHKPEGRGDAKSSEPASHKHPEKSKHAAKSSQEPPPRPPALLVKIDLRLLSRVPRASGLHQAITKSAPVTEREAAAPAAAAATSNPTTATHKHAKNSKKSAHPKVKADVDDDSLPKKRRKLEKKEPPSASASLKLESSSQPAEDPEPKKAKKNPQTLSQPPPKDAVPAAAAAKDSRSHKRGSGESVKEAGRSKDATRQHKRRDGKRAEETPHAGKKSSGEAANSRPLLQCEERQHPVKHYIKEAKRLKHKADAESDKLSKAFSYLEAAMFFVESGIAMERDPQISMSSYTMFADTVDLLKFVLKLKNSSDSSAPPSEKDFLALCLRCQSLLQMAMFHHKHKTALKYSKTLSDLFNNSTQATQEVSVSTPRGADTPSSSVPSPAATPAGSKHGGGGGGGGGLVAGPVSGTVVVPQAIQQAVFTYVNVTTLFLSAHDVWEQAEELASKGSGLLVELDATVGPLSLTSNVSSMVRYVRQGVLWLRLDSQKVK